MTRPALKGDNNPPSPIDEATAPFTDFIAEAETWLDGKPVSTDDQMKAVDLLTKHIKAALKAVNAGRDSEVKPLHDAWQAGIAAWKPTIADLGRIVKGLVSINSDHKAKKAAELAKKKHLAFVEAERIRNEAAEKARDADTGDIEAQREAAELQDQAVEADRAARNSETLGGMRKVQKYEILDHREALHWIAVNDKPSMTAFIDEYVRRNRKDVDIDGVRTWIGEEAF